MNNINLFFNWPSVLKRLSFVFQCLDADKVHQVQGGKCLNSKIYFINRSHQSKLFHPVSMKKYGVPIFLLLRYWILNYVLFNLTWKSSDICKIIISQAWLSGQRSGGTGSQRHRPYICAYHHQSPIVWHSETCWLLAALIALC